MNKQQSYPSRHSFAPVVRDTIEDFGRLLEEVMDFSDPDQRGSWYYRGDTGTGKTTAIMWHVARNAASRFVIAVPTRLAADQLYAQLKSWGVDVAVWTQAHDLRHPDPSGFEPSARFFKEQLADHRVVIGTHNFLLSSSSEVASYIGPRDLLIVDEVPLQFDGADALELTDFCRAWDEANALQSPAMYPLRRVLLWAEEVAGTIEGRRQYHKPELSESEEEWRGVAAMIKDIEATGEGRTAMRRVASFVLSSFEGRAFVQLQDGGGQNRTVFCTTTMKLPCVKRAIHVSATVHLEGWQVSPYRNQVRECRGLNLDYRNLEIIADAWPKELPTRYNDLLQSPQALQDFKRIIVDLVLKTPNDSKVLLVVPKKLLGHAQGALNSLELQFLDRPLMFGSPISRLMLAPTNTLTAPMSYSSGFIMHRKRLTSSEAYSSAKRMSPKSFWTPRLDRSRVSFGTFASTTTRLRSSNWAHAAGSGSPTPMALAVVCHCGPIRIMCRLRRSAIYSRVLS